MKHIITTLMATLFIAACTSAPQTTQVVVSLTPLAEDSGREGLDVEITLHHHSFSAGDTALSMPLAVTNVETVAATLGDIQATDERGSFTLLASEHEDSRVWTPSRDTQGSISFSYTALLPENPGSMGVAPPIELRAEGRSISGGTGVFFVQPQIDAAEYQFVWHLDHLSRDAAGLSSLGWGNTDFVSFESPAAFSSTYVMGGEVATYVADNADFIAAWQGEPPFSGLELMQWGEALYAEYNDFFEVADSETYVVFMRSNDVNPGGGMARGNSFIMTYDQNTEPLALQSTLSHEMFHTFLGGLEEPAGLESSWFSEGMAVYYQNIIPLRAGMMDVDYFLRGINRTAVRYYTNNKIDTPNHMVAEKFWLDTRVRVLPYDRGSLYFASLNHYLKQASDGDVSLDDMQVYLRQREQQGDMLTLDLWRAALLEFAGQEELERFEAVMDGAVIELADDAYGPCFERYVEKFRRYELGFAPEVLTEQPRRVRGLIAGSNAAEAGIEDGDIITRPVPQDAIQGNQAAMLTLTLQRDGETFDITYLPRGEEADAWQWRMVEDYSAQRCKEQL